MSLKMEMQEVENSGIMEKTENEYLMAPRDPAAQANVVCVWRFSFTLYGLKKKKKRP